MATTTSVFDLMFKSSKPSNKNMNTEAEHVHLYSIWFILNSMCTKASICITFLTH